MDPNDTTLALGRLQAHAEVEKRDAEIAKLKETKTE